MKNKIIAGSMFLSILAVLFPPWGSGGQFFQRFAFIFSESVPDKVGGPWILSIAWHILGVEIAVIFFAAIGLYWGLKDRR